MATTVVSGFSPDGYETYGKQFIETFHRHAPGGYDLRIYSRFPVPLPRGVCVPHADLNGAYEFARRHRDIPEHVGRAPTHYWREKDVRAKYSYRHDAVRFCWQLFYPEHAIGQMQDGDLLAWFDADVVFTAQIPSSFIESTLVDVDVAYLGRTNHSELGYWAIQVNPATRLFLKAMADLYRTDELFLLPEWHSAYVFDFCRKEVATLKERNLTEYGRGNVWDRSELAKFSQHLKGKLKYER